jgi:hypothetical protein
MTAPSDGFVARWTGDLKAGEFTAQRLRKRDVIRKAWLEGES